MSTIKSSKKYIQIAEMILEEIHKGKWKEGDVIPTVRALAEMYNVSPQTANKATSHLAGLGILASRQGSGSVITGKKSMVTGPKIPMLIDKARSSYLRGENSAVGYHGKELYLNYLHAMNEEGAEPALIIYNKGEIEISEQTKEILDSCEGVLIQGSLPSCYLDYLERNNIPSVIINRKLNPELKGRFGSVVMDDSGLEQLSAYMSSLGHRKYLYAFSNEFEMTTVYKNRRAIIQKSLYENYRTSQPEITDFTFSPGKSEDAEKLKGFISSGYTAIFCFNDICALRIYDLLHQMELRIPEEVSVCGFDDLFMAEVAAPPLTTVKVNRSELLNSSLELLKELLKLSSPSKIERSCRTDLIIRRSCWQKPVLG